MHIAGAENGILGANGIYADLSPLAVWAAVSAKMHKKSRIVAAFFGNEASNQGTFH